MLVSAICWHRSKPPQRDLSSLAVLFALYAFLLTGKILLYARVIQYGWTLAMPATIVLTIALFGWLPKLLARRGISPAPFLSGMIGVWTVVLAVHLVLTYDAMKQLKISVGQGGDQFLADDRGKYVNNAVKVVQQLVAEDGSIAAFPKASASTISPVVACRRHS